MKKWWGKGKEIERKYTSLKGQQVNLGPPKTSVKSTEDGIGRFRDYQDGSIYWSPETDAHEVHGAIQFKWNSLDRERGILGYPITDEIIASDGIGRFNHFQKGAIYWTPDTGAHEIHGPIFELWKSLGGELSKLGYPKSDEIESSAEGCVFSLFQHGSIYCDAERGAYEVFRLPTLKECDPAKAGQWEIAFYNSKVVGVHAALLHTNQVLFFSHGEPTKKTGQGDASEVGSAVLDLLSKEVRPHEVDNSVIGSGHTFLTDGRLIVCGSERKSEGVHPLRTFTPGGPDAGTWEHVSDLIVPRWYPTCTTLPDGRVFIVGGHQWFDDQNTPNYSYEIFSPDDGRQSLYPSPLMNENKEPAFYPFTFVLPSGKLLIHAGTRSYFLNLSTWTFDETVLESAPRPDRNARTYDLQGTAVLLPLLPDSDPPHRTQVMMIGGSGLPEVTARTAATDSCEILDLSAASPAWELANPMSNPRVMPDAVLLPDGTVFVTNGSCTGKAGAGANPVLDAELYDPNTGKWTTLCPMKIPRLYHSTALLLPDGSVLTAGADSVWYPASFQEAKLRVEIFNPPYLFRGPRPIIFHAPPQITYGAEFDVQALGTDTIKAAAIISLGSVTHSFNSSQRYVGLSITARLNNGLRLLSPPDPYVAPPGYYMLFLINSAGIPSIARFINVC